jgi:hypothetical protein
MKLDKNPSWQYYRKAKPLYCPHCHKEVYLRNYSLSMEPHQHKRVPEIAEEIFDDEITVECLC